VRDTLNLIYDLSERGVGARNLADPIKVDSSNPDDPMAQLAVVLLALLGQMERTYTMDRAAHARAVATAKGRRVGRPVLVDPAKLEYAAHLRDSGTRPPRSSARPASLAPACTATCRPAPRPRSTAGGGAADETASASSERRGRSGVGGAQRGGESESACAGVCCARTLKTAWRWSTPHATPAYPNEPHRGGWRATATAAWSGSPHHRDLTAVGDECPTVHRRAVQVAERYGWAAPSYATVHAIVQALDPAMVMLAQRRQALPRGV